MCTCNCLTHDNQTWVQVSYKIEVYTKKGKEREVYQELLVTDRLTNQPTYLLRTFTEST